MTKEEARGKMRSARKAFAGQERTLAQNEARERLISYLSKTRPEWFFPFVSCGTEIDTRSLIDEVFTRLPEISVAAPRVEGDRMQFYRIQSMEQLKQSPMGIPEPTGGTPVVPECGLVLMPGLVFDRQGNRAGYGAGYYDRYLAEHGLAAQNNGVLKMGYGFSFQLISELESEEHDIPLDAVLTERELYWI